MRKKSLTDWQMSSVDVVEQAAQWSRDLTHMRARGPGDLENAMRSIEREYGVDYWFQWALRYRRGRFRDIGYTAFLTLRAAYEAECARQQQRLSHEISIAKEIAGTNHAAVRQAEALVGDATVSGGVPKTVREA